MAELIAALPKPIQPHEFTVMDFVDEAKKQDIDMPYTTAFDHLKRLEKQGKLVSRKLKTGLRAFSRPQRDEGAS